MQRATRQASLIAILAVLAISNIGCGSDSTTSGKQAAPSTANTSTAPDVPTSSGEIAALAKAACTSLTAPADQFRKSLGAKGTTEAVHYPEGDRNQCEIHGLDGPAGAVAGDSIGIRVWVEPLGYLADYAAYAQMYASRKAAELAAPGWTFAGSQIQQGTLMRDYFLNVGEVQLHCQVNSRTSKSADYPDAVIVSAEKALEGCDAIKASLYTG